MFNEKEREQVNRYLSNETFTCSVPFFSTDGIEYEVEYSFKVVGERRMISVGEYFMYAEVDLEILDIEEKYKLYFKIMGKNFDKDRLVRIFFEKEYTFTNWIRECIGENLKYFTDGDYPRVSIKNITMSDELYENIMNKNTEDTV
jgi:hypothetical protein